MKRDLDLVRSILIYVENADDEVDADDMATERWPIETVAYHVRLMVHHGLLDVSQDARDMNGSTIELTVAGITWDGQDYLPFFQALAAMGYEGRLSLEGDTRGGLPQIRSSLAYLRQLTGKAAR